MSVLAAITLLAAVSAGPADFKEANEALLNNRFDRAIDLYRDLLTSGHDNPDVHYNLANAYLASGRRGMAILHYERALVAEPGDADARANLELAMKPLMSEPAFAPTEKTPIEEWFRSVPPAASAIAAIIMWVSLFSILIARRFMFSPGPRKALNVSLAAVLIIAAAACTLFAGSYWSREMRPRCVVLSDSAELKEGPSQSFKTVTGLKEGLTAGIRGSEAGWLRVVLPSGVYGWVRSETVEKI
jgi:tetratricopeptide (TPR) repeat protein